MRQIKEVLRLKYEMKLSVRNIARATRLARSTVSDYLRRARIADLEWPLCDSVDEQVLWEKLFHEDSTSSGPAGKGSTSRPLPEWSSIHKELRRKHVTLQLLWEEYRKTYPEGYGRSQFFELYKQWANKLDPVLRQTHEPGEKLFVDWAGDKIQIQSPEVGQCIQASLFVSAMGASHRIYAEAFLNEKLESWITGHIHALNFYGGVPRLIIPDNPKTAVASYCRYEPKIQATYQEMAEHYGTVILPARGYKPRDKAMAETAVLIAERRIMAVLRDHTFFSLGVLNTEIRKSLKNINAKAFTQKEGSRDELFETLDKPALKLLPEQAYELAHWSKAKVNIDYHVVFEKHFYSVSYQHVGQPVEVRATQSMVGIHLKGKRIALHTRSFQAGKSTTISEHRPKSHREHLSWTPGRLIGWGRKVGPCCGLLVSKILENRPHPEQGYRSCLGLMRLARDVGHERMEAASQRALQVQAYSYENVKNILKNKLDQLQNQSQLPLSAPDHENLRGSDYYQQSFSQNS